MKRKIVKIDEDKCNGCGLCITACHEGALQLVNGKARLVSESYCDGLGACLPDCPVDAISIEERDAAAFDEDAVNAEMARRGQHGQANGHTSGYGGGHAEGNTGGHSGDCGHAHGNPGIHSEVHSPAPLACGCPGTHARTIQRDKAVATSADTSVGTPGSSFQPAQTAGGAVESQLRQWPCQIQLVPVNAPYLDQAHLLIAADCTAYAYANIHQDFMRNRITVIGCPKLDEADYAGKLTAILKAHEIKSVTVLRMEVPCCSGIVQAVKQALLNSGKMIPWQVVVIGTDGDIVEQ